MRRVTAFPFGIAIVTVAMMLTSSLAAADPVHEVQVVAKKFAFEPADIQVVPGESVRLVIRSADAVHGFAIRGLNIEVQIPRGRAAVTVEFIAPPAGRYQIACSAFCGSGHGQMKAALASVMTMQTGR